MNLFKFIDFKKVIHIFDIDSQNSIIIFGLLYIKFTFIIMKSNYYLICNMNLIDL